jgi:hypothetical protein
MSIFKNILSSLYSTGQNTILRKNLTRYGSLQPEILVSFNLAKTGAKRLLWRFYFVKNFKSKTFLSVKVNSVFLKSCSHNGSSVKVWARLIKICGRYIKYKNQIVAKRWKSYNAVLVSFENQKFRPLINSQIFFQVCIFNFQTLLYQT